MTVTTTYILSATIFLSCWNQAYFTVLKEIPIIESDPTLENQQNITAESPEATLLQNNEQEKGPHPTNHNLFSDHQTNQQPNHHQTKPPIGYPVQQGNGYAPQYPYPGHQESGPNQQYPPTNQQNLGQPPLGYPPHQGHNQQNLGQPPLGYPPHQGHNQQNTQQPYPTPNPSEAYSPTNQQNLGQPPLGYPPHQGHNQQNTQQPYPTPNPSEAYSPTNQQNLGQPPLAYPPQYGPHQQNIHQQQPYAPNTHPTNYQQDPPQQLNNFDPFQDPLIAPFDMLPPPDMNMDLVSPMSRMIFEHMSRVFGEFEQMIKQMKLVDQHNFENGPFKMSEARYEIPPNPHVSGQGFVRAGVYRRPHGRKHNVRIGSLKSFSPRNKEQTEVTSI